MFQNLTNRAAPLVENAVDRTRNMTVLLADIVARATRPVDVAADVSLKLNKITHTGAARLIKQNARTVEGTMTAASKRLHVAADATSLRNLIDDQVAMVQATRKRLTGDARKTVEVLAETRDELTDLARDTMVELRGTGDDVQVVAKNVKKAVKTKARTVRKTAAKTSTKVKARTKKKVSKARRSA